MTAEEKARIQSLAKRILDNDYQVDFKSGGKIHIKPKIFNGKVYYRDGGILEGDFDVDDISDEELYELDRLGYDVDIL